MSLTLEQLKEFVDSLKYEPKNYPIEIPAAYALGLNDEDFKAFMNSKQNYHINCNLGQYQELQKRFNATTQQSKKERD
jgi:hypothetical protein